MLYTIAMNLTHVLLFMLLTIIVVDIMLRLG